jgi:hypothetical protein
MIALAFPRLIAELTAFKAAPMAFTLNLTSTRVFGRTFADEQTERAWQGWLNRAQVAANDQAELVKAVEGLLRIATRNDVPETEQIEIATNALDLLQRLGGKP